MMQAAEKRQHVDAEGHSYTVAEPALPELEPGRTVTYVPERWCERCQEARGGTLCAMCGDRTVAQTAAQQDAGALERAKRVAEAPELEQLPELAAANPRPMPAVKVSPGLERMRARAAELETPPEPPPAIVEPARRRPMSAVAAAIDNQHRERPWRPLTSGRTRDMGLRDAREREYDESGREVHRMSRHQGVGSQSAEDQLISLWKKAKIDQPTWCQFAAGFAASHPELEPHQVADLADQLYIALIQRQNLVMAG